MNIYGDISIVIFKLGHAVNRILTAINHNGHIHKILLFSWPKVRYKIKETFLRFTREHMTRVKCVLQMGIHL